MGKIIFGLSGIIIPLLIIFFIETFISTADGFSTNIFAIFIIPVFGSPLWVSLIVLGIIEIKRNKKIILNENNDQAISLNKDLKITSFLCSLAIGMMSFGFLTGGGGYMKLPILIHNYYYVLIIAIIITYISFIIIYKKFKKIEKLKPGFITEIFFNKSYNGKFNGIGYETYEEITKEVRNESNNFPVEKGNEYKPEVKDMPKVLLGVHKDIYSLRKQESTLGEYKKSLLDEMEIIDEIYNTDFTSEEEKNSIQKGVELIKEYIDSELKN